LRNRPAKKVRLTQVESAPHAASGSTFNFQDTQRKDYIMDKLVVPVEE
jgi:hypothetical protein